MIKLAGSTNLSFTFPAQLNTAVDYYRDFPRTLALLPHITVIRDLGEHKYRLLYSSLERGIYQVKLICDIQITFDETRRTLKIEPLEEYPPVKSEVTLYSLISQGYYRSTSIFHPRDDETTVIDYQLNLNANLPTPFASRLVPNAVLTGVARNIASRRIHEIAQRFIQRSLEDFRGLNKQNI
jgi:hypothetical protein